MSGEKKRFKLNGAVVNHCAMDHELAEQCVDLATAAVRDYYTEQEIAAAVKAQLEAVHQGNWHVFVGRKFGCYVTHEEGKFIYFYIGQVGVCIFQS